MKKIILFLVGIIPFLVGWLLNWGTEALFSNTTPPYILIGIIMLVLWCLFSHIFCKNAKSFLQAVVLLNLPAFIVLGLNMIRLLVFNDYWNYIISQTARYYYLPLVHVSDRLVFWTSRIFAASEFTFILMLAASALGCFLARARRLR